MNLKIKDKQGKVKAVLRDEDIEPTFDKEILEEEEEKEEELKKKKDIKDEGEKDESVG
jgi:hypothetical protein